jgi:hypothetical protein
LVNMEVYDQLLHSYLHAFLFISINHCPAPGKKGFLLFGKNMAVTQTLI